MCNIHVYLSDLKAEVVNVHQCTNAYTCTYTV